MTQTTEELERPAWGVWVDYKIAPPGSYACLVSRFMDNRWTDPEQQWMPAQLRPQLHGEVKVMPYLMPSDPLAAVNALPELLALRKENERLRELAPRLILTGLRAGRAASKSGASLMWDGELVSDANWSREATRAALSQEAGS